MTYLLKGATSLEAMNETLPLLKPKDPTSTASDNEEKEELPKSLRVITNTLSLISVFFFSGIIFGWAPLELMLLREGVYARSSFAANATFLNDESGQQQPDEQQIQRLNAIFTIAQFLLSFASLPVGFLVDHAPKPLYFGCTAAFEVTGLFLFAYDHFMSGYALISLGGCMTMLGSFPASFLLPGQQAGLLAAISCLFDASSIVFFVFHRLGLQYSVMCSRRNLFLVWSLVALVVYSSLAACWSILEQKDWKTILEQEAEAKDALASKRMESTENGQADNHIHNRQHRLHHQSVARQLCTFEFALVLIFAAVHMLRCNFYIMTVDDFLWKLGDTDSTFANLFSIILPCGIVYVPLIEGAIDKLGIVQTLYLTNGLGVIFGVILLLSKNLVVQALDFVIFTGFRAFLYASMNTAIAVYFGVNTMGRVIGCTFTLAAIVSLLQYPAALYADQSASGSLDNQGGHFFLVNAIMLSLCALPIVSLVWYDQMIQGRGESMDVGIVTDENHESFARTKPSPRLSAGMLLASPGSGLRNSLRQVQRMRKESSSFNAS